MNRLLVMMGLGLLGCGGAVFIEKADGSIRQSSSVTTPPGPWSYCVQTCDRVKEQLIRDFAVLPPIDCLASDFQNATTCSTCNEVFVRRYGLQLTSCE